MPRRKNEQAATVERTTPQPKRYGKQALLDLWESLDPDQPLRLRPIHSKHKGTTYAEDTIRLTGSQEFINSFLARNKDLLEYDSNGSRLNLVYTETQGRTKDPETGKIIAGELTGSWAFYLRAVERSNDPRGRKTGSNNRPKEPRPEPLPRLNAHLRVQAKPVDMQQLSKDINTVARHREPQKLNTTHAQAMPADPVYVLANEKLIGDEDGWIEPTGDKDIPFTIYEDLFTASNAAEGYRRNKNFKGVKIVPVEVILLGKGRYKLTGQ